MNMKQRSLSRKIQKAKTLFLLFYSSSFILLLIIPVFEECAPLPSQGRIQGRRLGRSPP